MTVRSPQTEHHEGRESRLVPLFPELRPHLEGAFDAAEPGTEFVITRYRDKNSNLRTQFERIIRKAGLQPWPKPFQNLRSTRETELAESFPIHVVCAWIGNSQAVATKHYLQVTDDHFEAACTALHNPVQLGAEAGRTEPHETQQPLVIAENCEGLLNCTNDHAPRQGLRPARKSSGKSGRQKQGDPECDPLLGNAWHTLSVVTRLAILAIVNAAR